MYNDLQHSQSPNPRETLSDAPEKGSGDIEAVRWQIQKNFSRNPIPWLIANVSLPQPRNQRPTSIDLAHLSSPNGSKSDTTGAMGLTTLKYLRKQQIRTDYIVEYDRLTPQNLRERST